MPVTGAGLEGIVATESRLCFIDGDAGLLSYQGFRIETLAEHATFEETVYLLWHGKLPKQSELDELKAALVANRAIPVNIYGDATGESRQSSASRTDWQIVREFFGRYPERYRANFAVFDLDSPAYKSEGTVAMARATFGRPAPKPGPG